MRRFLILATILLAGCESNPPQPRMQCVSEGSPYACGKGGTSTCRECLRKELSCPVPLELDQIDTGKLICRLHKGDK